MMQHSHSHVELVRLPQNLLPPSGTQESIASQSVWQNPPSSGVCTIVICSADEENMH